MHIPFSIFGRPGNPIDVAYLALVASCLAALLTRYAVLRWQAAQANETARCACCGYIIVADTSVVCPECGTDLRDGGIVTARTPAPMRGGKSLRLLIALVALPITFVISGIAQPYLPVGWEFMTADYVDAADETRTAARYAVECHGYGRYFGKRSNLLWVYLQNANDPPRDQIIIMRPDATRIASWSTTQAVVKRDIPFDLEHVRQFVNASSPTLSRDRRDAVARAILASVRRLAAGEFPSAEQHTLHGLYVNYFLRDKAMHALLGGVYITLLAASLLTLKHLNALFRRARRRRNLIEATRLRLVAAP